MTTEVMVGVPKWLFLALFVLAFLVVIVRIAYSFRALNARKNIFGNDKRLLRNGAVSNMGYAFVSFLLGIYFLLLYSGSGLATPVFEAMLFSLLLVLIVDATFKKKT